MPNDFLFGSEEEILVSSEVTADLPQYHLLGNFWPHCASVCHLITHNYAPHICSFQSLIFSFLDPLHSSRKVKFGIHAPLKSFFKKGDVCLSVWLADWSVTYFAISLLCQPLSTGDNNDDTKTRVDDVIVQRSGLSWFWKVSQWLCKPSLEKLGDKLWRRRGIRVKQRTVWKVWWSIRTVVAGRVNGAKSLSGTLNKWSVLVAEATTRLSEETY